MDSFLLGSLVFALGVIVGGGGVWLVTHAYERERSILHQVIGRYQQAMEEQSIPEEEL